MPSISTVLQACFASEVSKVSKEGFLRPCGSKEKEAPLDKRRDWLHMFDTVEQLNHAEVFLGALPVQNRAANGTPIGSEWSVCLASPGEHQINAFEHLTR